MRTQPVSRIRHKILALSAASALLAVVALPVSSVFAQTTLVMQTLAGSNRMATATAVANQEYPDGPASHTVILASGANANLVDSVTAAPLAQALGAPILLSASPKILSATTQAYLTTHAITTVYLVGADANAVLKSKLPATVTTVQALSGANRYETAAAIAQALLKITGQSAFATVFVASGEDPNLSDALAAAPFAAHLQAPILFAAPNSTTLPGNEAEWVTNLPTQTLYLVGAATGYGLQSADTVDNVGSATGSSFANAVAVAQKFSPGSGYTAIDLGNDSQTEVVNANGLISYHLVDAITGGPLAALEHAAILFTNGATITPSTAAFLQGSHAHAVSALNIFGGPASIPSSTGSQAAQDVAHSVPTVPALSAVTLNGQTFGTGSVTAPAVTNSGTPITCTTTLSSGGTGLTGVDLTLTILGATAPTVTANGTTLSSSAITGGWTYAVPTDQGGTATVSILLPAGESGSYTAQFSAPFTVNGTALTGSTESLQFVTPNSMAIAPYGDASTPYAVPLSTATDPTQGVIPVTVTLPPMNGAAQVNVPVTLTLSPNFAKAYVTDVQGAGDFGTTYTAYTNADGQALFYVNSNTAGESTALASYDNGTVTQHTRLEWGQAGIPSAIALTVSNGQSNGTTLTVATGASATIRGTVHDVLGQAVPNAEILVTASAPSTDSAGDYVNGTTETAFPVAAPFTGAMLANTGAPYGTLVTANSLGEFSVSVTNSATNAVTYHFWYVQNDDVANVGQQSAGQALASTTLTYSVVNPTLPTAVQASLLPTSGWMAKVNGIDAPASTTQTVYFDAQNGANTDILAAGADPSGSVTYEVSTSAGSIDMIDGVALTGNGTPAASPVETVEVQGDGAESSVLVDNVPINTDTDFQLPASSTPGVIGVGVTNPNTGVAQVTAAVAEVSSSATAAVNFTAGIATQILVAPAELTLTPGESQTVTITVEDHANNPVANAVVPLSFSGLGVNPGLWLTAVDGKELTTNVVYGSPQTIQYPNVSTPIPLYAKDNLAYTNVDIPDTLVWSQGNPAYLYTNSAGQVTVTLQAGAVGYLKATSAQTASTTISNPDPDPNDTTPQVAYWSFAKNQIQLTAPSTPPSAYNGEIHW